MNIQKEDRTSKTIANILWVIALLGLIFEVGSALYNYGTLARLSVGFRYPMDYGEGPLLDQTLRLISGESLYHNNFAAPPYTISNYPPLFLLVQAPFAAIFGPALWYGRAISILSAILTALFIALTLQTLTDDWLASITGGLMVLIFPYVQFWSMLNRIDSLALALSWAGIFVIVRWSDTRRGILWGGLLLIAAIYTRQSYALAAPAGVFVWLLTMRRYRKAFTLALLVGGVSLALFLVINIITRGGFFLNIVTANVNPFSWGTVKYYWNNLYQHVYWLFGVIGLYLVLERFFPHTRTWTLVLPYLVGASLSALTVGKDGSNVNYLFELAAALSLGAGAALAWFARSRWLRITVTAVLAVQVSVLLVWSYHDANNLIYDKTKQEDAIAQMFHQVQTTDGLILSDEYMGLVPLAGKRLYYQPFEFKMLAEGGLWDQTPFVGSIIDKKYSLILWYDPIGWSSMEARWTPMMRQAIQSSYKMEDEIGHTQIRLPRK